MGAGRLALVAVEIAVCIPTCLLNTIAVAAFVTKRQLHTPSNVILGVLAIADLLVGLVLFPWRIHRSVGESFGQVECLAYKYIARLLLGNSGFLFTAVSIDRCAAICYPYWYHRNVTCKRYIAGCILAMALVMLTVPLIIYLQNHIRQLTLMAVVIITVWICYTKIVIVVRRQNAAIAKVTVITQQGREEAMRRKREQRQAVTVALVIITQLLCYAPYFVTNALQRLSANSETTCSTFRWAQSFLLFNSAINPCIYFLRNKLMRQAAREVITRSMRCNSRD